MTFIASIVAKKGVAIIADSLVASSKSMLEFEDFAAYAKNLADANEDKLKFEEVSKLFKLKPTYTKDYEDKLYEYDKYTAITTAGAANINDRKIEKIISDASKALKSKSKGKKIDARVNELKEYIESQVVEHLEKKTSIRRTVFVVTHFSKTSNLTSIFKIEVKACSRKDLDREDYELVTVVKQPNDFRVVCDGQNRISERILFGNLQLILDVIPKVAVKVAQDFDIDIDKLGEQYFLGLLGDEQILPRAVYEDIKIHKLTELSLQQAVDLACLLMKIEIDMQKYTENIPTVGGLIKLAVIDKKGFRLISGDDVVKPDVL